MATIKTGNGHTDGVSDCGRIIYQHNNAGHVRIDGRWAWRGNYVDLTTGFANAGEVDDADWLLAIALMQDTNAAHAAYSDALRDKAYAKQDARDDAVVEREDWLRKNTHGTYVDYGSF